MKRAAIISGGPYTKLKDIEECDYVIACDKGYEYSLKDQLKVDLFIGDLDSYNGFINTKSLILPTVKDDTDTNYAYNWLIEHNFKEVYLYCAIGLRFDHTFANIQSAIKGAKNNISTKIYDDTNIIYVTNKKHLEINKIINYSFSLFAVDYLEGVSIKGSKYDVNNIDLTNDYPLGVSNEFIDNKITIDIKEGISLIILSEVK